MSCAVLLLLAISTPAWRSVAAGVEHSQIDALHVVRVDPSVARLKPLAISDAGGRMRTAREWRDEFKLAAVINLGMFEQDYSTHTGFLRVGKHINSRRWVKSYQSILLLAPGEARIEDLVPGERYEGAVTVVQNLRLVRAPGVNVWQQSDKKWSEAAIAMDRSGRILFLFSRAPMTMHDFNHLLLALPLGIVRAMHVEGGPEASLSLYGGGIELDLAGSYETGFNENDDNVRQWPLPNVLGVEAD